jgi:hypothetical protein
MEEQERKAIQAISNNKLKLTDEKRRDYKIIMEVIRQDKMKRHPIIHGIDGECINLKDDKGYEWQIKKDQKVVNLRYSKFDLVRTNKKYKLSNGEEMPVELLRRVEHGKAMKDELDDWHSIFEKEVIK